MINTRNISRHEIDVCQEGAEAKCALNGRVYWTRGTQYS